MATSLYSFHLWAVELEREREGIMEPVIQLTREPLDRAALIAAVSHYSVGGIVVFEGVVRDNARGKMVR